MITEKINSRSWSLLVGSIRIMMQHTFDRLLLKKNCYILRNIIKLKNIHLTLNTFLFYNILIIKSIILNIFKPKVIFYIIQTRVISNEINVKKIEFYKILDNFISTSVKLSFQYSWILFQKSFYAYVYVFSIPIF